AVGISVVPSDRRMTTTGDAAAASPGTVVGGSVPGPAPLAMAAMRPSAAAPLRLPTRMRPPVAAWWRRALGRGRAVAVPGPSWPAGAAVRGALRRRRRASRRAARSSAEGGSVVILGTLVLGPVVVLVFALVPVVLVFALVPV